MQLLLARRIGEHVLVKDTLLVLHNSADCWKDFCEVESGDKNSPVTPGFFYFIGQVNPVKRVRDDNSQSGHAKSNS